MDAPAGRSALALGIDLGTSGPKVGVFAADGRLLGAASHRVPTVRGRGGAAEQDPGQVWLAVVDATRQALAAAGGVGAGVAAVGVTSQYSSIVPVGPGGLPTGPMLTWMDTRGGSHNRAVLERHPDALFRWLDVHGLPPLPSGADSLGHLLHLQHDRPEVHEATAAYVEPMDYVTARLTGRLTATRCSAFMLLLTDNRDGAPDAWHPELVELAGVDATRLPPVVPVDQPLGPVRPDVAEVLGISPAALVVPGLNDTQIGGVATGALLGGGGAGMCIGTTSVLIAAIDRKDLDATHQLATMPSPLGGHMLMAENGNGGKLLDHAVGELLGADLADLDPLVAGSAPGAGGALFLPWLGGAMAPVDDPRMRGGFLGVSLHTTRADLARAVLEGVAHNLRWLLEPAETFCRRRFDHLAFSGGGARSAAWTAILADVLDRPVRRLADPAHANGRAAALLALARTGAIALGDLPAALPADHLVEPTADPEVRARYDRHHELFVAAFAATQPIAHALRRS